MILKSYLKIGYEKTHYFFSFIYIKNEYAKAHKTKKIMLTIKLIFHYQVR